LRTGSVVEKEKGLDPVVAGLQLHFGEIHRAL
jgi:hypothetical protein